MRILGSTSAARSGQLLLLAPSATSVPDAFPHADVNPSLHERILSQLQRLRGSVYLHDGAIESWQLSPSGRHVQDADALAWHLVAVQSDGRVTGCARYRVHDANVAPEDLGVWKSALARSLEWGRTLRAAVQGEIDQARRRRLSYAEVGGWAIAEDYRFTTQALQVALSTYALAQSLGGCLGITTATVRNCSSRILRKIGGRSLEYGDAMLPAYYDPQYRCEMELLRFDSQAPQKYQSRIDEILERLLDVPVLCAGASEFGTGLTAATVRNVPVPAQACA